MTSDIRDATPDVVRRLHNWFLAHPTGDEVSSAFPPVAGGFAALIFGGFVISQHTAAYEVGGAPAAVAGSGAFAGQLAVAAVLFTATVLLLHGHRHTLRAAVTGGGAALAFALLPALVGGGGWLTVLLRVLVTLVFNTALAGVFVVIGRFAGLVR